MSKLKFVKIYNQRTKEVKVCQNSDLSKFTIKIRYGTKHKVKFKRVKFCDIGFMTKHKVKFKKVEFCRVKLMKWALKKSSFRNHILMGKLAQASLVGLTVPNKKK